MFKVYKKMRKKHKQNEKNTQERSKHCAHDGCSKVQTPPTHPLSQTHRQDRLQYTVP